MCCGMVWVCAGWGGRRLWASEGLALEIDASRGWKVCWRGIRYALGYQWSVAVSEKHSSLLGTSLFGCCSRTRRESSAFTRWG